MLFKLRDILGKKKWIFIFFSLFIIIEIIMFFILKDINMKEFFELQITTNKDNFLKIIASWNSEQVKSYHNHFWLDFVYLIIYSLFLFSIISYYLNRGHVKKRGSFFLILPFIISFFDIIENLFHIYFINVNYEAPRIYFVITGVLSIQKWVLVFVALYVILVLFLKLTIVHKK